jgi:hypothetical protein
LCFAFDVRPDRSSSSIAVAGLRADGLPHVEIVDRKRGTSWVPARLVELTGSHTAAGVLCDQASPAASLIKRIAKLDIDVQSLSAQETAQACGSFYDAVHEAMLRHLGTTDMTAAIRGAATRMLGDAWAWSRKSSAVDISPLVASTLALWGLTAGDLQTVKPTFEVLL